MAEIQIHFKQFIGISPALPPAVSRTVVETAAQEHRQSVTDQLKNTEVIKVNQIMDTIHKITVEGQEQTFALVSRILENNNGVLSVKINAVTMTEAALLPRKESMSYGRATLIGAGIGGVILVIDIILWINGSIRGAFPAILSFIAMMSVPIIRSFLLNLDP